MNTQDGEIGPTDLDHQAERRCAGCDEIQDGHGYHAQDFLLAAAHGYVKMESDEEYE